METIDIDGLAKILNRSPQTISSQASKHPERLPPRVRLPGSRRVLWLKKDVEEWLEKHRDKES